MSDIQNVDGDDDNRRGASLQERLHNAKIYDGRTICESKVRAKENLKRTMSRERMSDFPPS